MEQIVNIDVTKQIAQVELGSQLTKITARGVFNEKDALDFTPTPESVFLHVDVPNYDGPLDLLLHLIQKHSIDIFDIPIVFITKKYLQVLDEMQELNLDIAGEFVLMAATLTQIKSKMLLPKEERIKDDDDEEDDVEVDPRTKLVKRLLAYKSFQEAAMLLGEKQKMGNDFFLRQNFFSNHEIESELIKKEGGLNLEPIEMNELVDNLMRILKTFDEQIFHTVSKERVSISVRIRELMDYCYVRTNFSFYEAISFFPVYEKIDVIVTFLALLEMSRLKLLKVEQETEDFILDIVKENFYHNQEDILKNLKDIKEEENG